MKPKLPDSIPELEKLIRAAQEKLATLKRDSALLRKEHADRLVRTAVRGDVVLIAKPLPTIIQMAPTGKRMAKFASHSFKAGDMLRVYQVQKRAKRIWVETPEGLWCLDGTALYAIDIFPDEMRAAVAFASKSSAVFEL